MNYIIEQSIKRKNKVFITAMIMLFKILTAVLLVAALLIPSMFFIHLKLIVKIKTNKNKQKIESEKIFDQTFASEASKSLGYRSKIALSLKTPLSSSTHIL
mgnify:CR=1 FL=1